MKGKYIIKEYGPILFNDCYNHNDYGSRETVKSAGFFRVQQDPNESHGIKVSCWGKSTSLNRESNPIEDEKKIKRLICNLDIEDDI